MLNVALWNKLKITTVLAMALIWWCTAAMPIAQAGGGEMRVIDYEDTDKREDPPKTVMTVYNETDLKLRIGNLEDNVPPYKFYYDIVTKLTTGFPDIQAMGNQSSPPICVAPHDRFEYVGMISPRPVMMKGMKYYRGWHFHLVSAFNVVIQPSGDDRDKTTPYDISVSHIDWGMRIDGTLTAGGVATRKEDKMIRIGIRSDNGKKYIMTWLLGHRAHGSIRSDPSHLTIVFQEADDNMIPGD